MSTVTHISSLTSDEITSDPMPMKIYVNQAKLVLQVSSTWSKLLLNYNYE